MKAKGRFELTMDAEPPYDTVDGVMLARASFEKRFSGPLDATSKVNMLSARGPIEGSAGYVAIERVVGTLDGRRGSFVLQHTGVMKRGERCLTINVVPDSGTEALRSISGKMDIEIANGQHFYEFEYALEAASPP